LFLLRGYPPGPGTGTKILTVPTFARDQPIRSLLLEQEQIARLQRFESADAWRLPEVNFARRTREARRSN
jgi:hypothetical protein